jgi:hypothetical protein
MRISQFWIEPPFGLRVGAGGETRAAPGVRDRRLVHSLARESVYKITMYVSDIHGLHAEIDHDRLLVHLTNGS